MKAIDLKLPGSTRSSLCDQIQSSVAFSIPVFQTKHVCLLLSALNTEPAVNIKFFPILPNKLFC